MSWEHGTFGWNRIEAFLEALMVVGIPYTVELKEEAYMRGSDIQCMCYCGYGPEEPSGCPCCQNTCGHSQKLRKVSFRYPDGQQMIAEEYLAVKDLDCDGASLVDYKVYPAGEKPDLQTKVLEAY